MTDDNDKPANDDEVPRLPTAEERTRTRTSKFNERNRDLILENIAAGAWRNQAAAIAGVGERTLKRWTSRGRENLTAVEAFELGETDEQVELDDYGLFTAKLLQAEENAENKLLIKVINLAGDDNVPPRDRLKAATWLLERRNRRRYGPAPVEVTGKDGGPIEVDARQLLTDRLADLAARQTTAADPSEPDA